MYITYLEITYKDLKQGTGMMLISFVMDLEITYKDLNLYQ